MHAINQLLKLYTFIDCVFAGQFGRVFSAELEDARHKLREHVAVKTMKCTFTIASFTTFKTRGLCTFVTALNMPGVLPQLGFCKDN